MKTCCVVLVGIVLTLTLLAVVAALIPAVLAVVVIGIMAVGLYMTIRLICRSVFKRETR